MMFKHTIQQPVENEQIFLQDKKMLIYDIANSQVCDII